MFHNIRGFFMPSYLKEFCLNFINGVIVLYNNTTTTDNGDTKWIQ